MQIKIIYYLWVENLDWLYMYIDLLVFTINRKLLLSEWLSLWNHLAPFLVSSDYCLSMVVTRTVPSNDPVRHVPQCIAVDQSTDTTAAWWPPNVIVVLNIPFSSWTDDPIEYKDVTTVRRHVHVRTLYTRPWVLPHVRTYWPSASNAKKLPLGTAANSDILELASVAVPKRGLHASSGIWRSAILCPIWWRLHCVN